MARQAKRVLVCLVDLGQVRLGIAGTLNERGGQRLMRPLQSVPPETNASLKVELRENGGVKIQAPAPTNSH